MSASSLICTHLNASVGHILLLQDVEDSLRRGCLYAHNEQANALLASLFVEVEPRLIALCALESGSNLFLANQLYLDILKSGYPRCKNWEKSVEHLF